MNWLRESIQVVSYLYDHQVDDIRGGKHTHEYKAVYPQFIRKIKFSRDIKRCVYTSIQKSPERVYDDEIQYILAHELDDATDTPTWIVAEKILSDRYREGEFDRKTGYGYIERVAAAQLARAA